MGKLLTSEVRVEKNNHPWCKSLSELSGRSDHITPIFRGQGTYCPPVTNRLYLGTWANVLIAACPGDRRWWMVTVSHYAKCQKSPAFLFKYSHRYSKCLTRLYSSKMVYSDCACPLNSCFCSAIFMMSHVFILDSCNLLKVSFVICLIYMTCLMLLYIHLTLWCCK